MERLRHAEPDGMGGHYSREALTQRAEPEPVKLPEPTAAATQTLRLSVSTEREKFLNTTIGVSRVGRDFCLDAEIDGERVFLHTSPEYALAVAHSLVEGLNQLKKMQREAGVVEPWMLFGRPISFEPDR